jgi:hypothetical protein
MAHQGRKDTKDWDGNPACLPLEVFGYKISFAFMAWRVIFRRISTNEMRLFADSFHVSESLPDRREKHQTCAKARLEL